MDTFFYPTYSLARQFQITGLHTAFVESMMPNHSSIGEAHDFCEILLILDGELSIATGKDVFRLKRNCMYFHAPMEFHRHFNRTQHTATFAVLSFDACGIPATVMSSFYLLAPEEVEEFISIVSMIKEYHLTAFLDPPGGHNHEIDQTLFSRIELFLSIIFSKQPLPRKTISSEYKRIVKYLSENVERKLTVPMIAHELNMSTPNLKRVFSKYSGIGLMKYFNHLKTQKAILMLENGKSVREVSEQLSYSSQSAFSTAFKAITGTSPSKYHR